MPAEPAAGEVACATLTVRCVPNFAKSVGGEASLERYRPGAAETAAACAPPRAQQATISKNAERSDMPFSSRHAAPEDGRTPILSEKSSHPAQILPDSNSRTQVARSLPNGVEVCSRGKRQLRSERWSQLARRSTPDGLRVMIMATGVFTYYADALVSV